MALDVDRDLKTIVARAPLLPRGVMAALGVGVAFGMGVVVGGGLGTARGQAPELHASDDVFRRAEQRAEELERTRTTIRLSAVSDLVKADAPPAPHPDEKLGKVAVATPSAHTSADDGAETPPEPPERDAPAEPARAAQPPEAAPPSAPAATPTAPSAQPAPSRGPSPALLAAGSAHATATATATAADDDDVPGTATASATDAAADASPSAPTSEKAEPAKLQAALARVLGDGPALVDGRTGASGFALQVASSPTRVGAEAIMQKLMAQGHRNARIVEGDVGGRAVFRVRVGGFKERSAADAYKGKLSAPAFIVAE